MQSLHYTQNAGEAQKFPWPTVLNNSRPGYHARRPGGVEAAPAGPCRHPPWFAFATPAPPDYTLRVNSSKIGGTIVATAEHKSQIPLSGPEATPGFQARGVMSLSGAHMIHDLFGNFVPPLLPIFLATLGLSKTQAGLLVAFQQGPSLLQPVLGQLVDRHGLRPLVYIGPAVTAVVMSLLGIAPSYTVLAVMLLIVGLNSAAFHSVGSVMAGTLSGRRLGRGTGLWMFGAELGRSIGPLLVVAVVQRWGPKGLPWLSTIGLVGAAVLYWQLRNVPFRPARSMAQSLPWKQAIRGMGAVMLPIVGIVTARGLLVAALTTYLPTYLQEEGSGLVLAGASLSIFEAAGMIGALSGGSLSDWLGRRKTVAIAMVACTPLMALFLLSDGWLRILSLLGLGFFLLSTLGVLMALVQESFPQNRALANGLYLASYFVANSVMAVVVGRLGDLYGLRSAFTISAVAPLLGAAMVWLLPRGTPRTA
jgi:FSR family fosmidomycin resistance protein-like MFS transporter